MITWPTAWQWTLHGSRTVPQCQVEIGYVGCVVSPCDLHGPRPTGRPQTVWLGYTCAVKCHPLFPYGALFEPRQKASTNGTIAAIPSTITANDVFAEDVT